MKHDISRNTFDPRKHFSRVLMQQGRVQLDADWNEQAAIFFHCLRTLASDLIGPHAWRAGISGEEYSLKREGGSSQYRSWSLASARCPKIMRSRSESTRRYAIAATALLCGLLSAAGLRAAPILGVIATTPVPPGGASDISHIVDGSGLFDPGTGLPIYTTGATHGRAFADSTFASGGAVPVTSGSITFDLGGLYALDGMAIWNFNGFNQVGVKDVIVLGSTDEINFTVIDGAPGQFAIGANAAPEVAELFSFSRTASFVRFDVLSAYGNFDFGLSEVMFTGSGVVPEPSCVALGLSGMVMLLARVRRRRV